MTPEEITEWRILVVYLIGFSWGFVFWLCIAYCVLRKK